MGDLPGALGAPLRDRALFGVGYLGRATQDLGGVKLRGWRSWIMCHAYTPNDAGSTPASKQRPDPDEPKVIPTESLQVAHRGDGALQVMELLGEADLSTREVLRAGLDALRGDDRVGVIVDLSRLRFCEVHSAQMILDLATRGRLVLVGPGGSVKRVLEILDPHQVVPRYRRMCDATTGR